MSKHFESIFEKLYKKFKREGKVETVDLSEIETEEFREEMEKIHEDYVRKSNAAWNDTKDIVIS